jgi:phosphatidylserine/phosphatidylglycerophosphate/cardiolipin synthase-like enzyme
VISGLGAMVPPGGQLTLAPAPFPVPSPVTGATEPAARFAGTPVHWLHVGGFVPVSAIARGSRRVYRQLAPGLPDGTSTAATLIEVSPLPGFLAGALRRLAGGFPVQYVLLDAADTALVANPDDEALVAVEEELLTPAHGYWLAVCGQDRVCRDPAAWVLALDDAAQAGGVGVTQAWGGFRAAVTAAAGPRIRVLTHTGAPLPDGQFLITTGGATHNVTITPASHGDTSIDVAGGTARIVAVNPPGTAVLASSENNAGALGTELALTGSDRHVLVSDTSLWFARRSARVTRMAEWTAGNTYEPIVDGAPYFQRLVPDLRSAENGDPDNRGAVVLAGWVFVKEALLDQTRPWTLLPEDDSTELIALIDELSKTAQVQLLVNQFLQMDGAQLDTLRVDAAVVLAFIIVLIGWVDGLRWLMTDMAGWTLLAAGLTLIPALPDSLLRDALTGLAEASKSTVEAVNVAPHQDIAVWTPYAAVLGDNPLAPHPVTVAGFSVDDVDNHFGVYHAKAALIKPAGATQHPFCYLGGIDLSPNRLDDPLHRAVVPFHDLQVRLSGPAVNDVIQTIAERASVHGATPPAALTPPSDPNAPPLVPMPDPPGPHIVQVGRTYYAPAGGAPGPYASAPRGERTTRDTVLRAIASAREYIYIEDQYFTPTKQVLEALLTVGQNMPDLQLMVTLVEDNGQLYGELRRDYVYAQLAAVYHERFRVGTALRRYVDPDPGTFGGLGRMLLRAVLDTGVEEMVVGPAERCPTPPFWAFVESELVYVQEVVPNGSGTGRFGPQDSADPDPPDQTWQKLTVVRSPAPSGAQWGAKQDRHDKASAVLAVQIPAVYIHAKLILVDDVFASIGSTNFNRRSFEHDGEIHAFALPQALKRDPANPALRLRCQVWAEHLGLPPELGLSLLADPRSALGYFDRSWYRGSRWRSLLTALGPDATPAIGMPLSGSAFQTAVGVAMGVIEDAEESEIWAALVDPTSAGDPFVNPATDRGPLG